MNVVITSFSINKKIASLAFSLFAALFLNLAIFLPVLAVPPPEFIFAVVSNMGIIAAFSSAFFIAMMASLRSYTAILLHTTRGRLITALVFVALSAGTTLAIHQYQVWQQERSYALWLKQSDQEKLIEATPTPVASSEPTSLPTPTPSSSQSPAPNPTSTPLPSFYSANKDLPRVITNADFSQSLKNGTPYVLDAREDEENRYGRFPGSVHTRFADITAGEWKNIPSNQVIYVLCWSGIRGKEVADFLFSKGIIARYLEKGADGWVSYGGKWEGGIKFDKIHPEERFHLVLETSAIESAIQDGVTLVDSRTKASYQKWHISSSVNLPIIYTPTSSLASAFEQIPLGAKVITICDDFVSCFDARLVGLKAEEDRKATFLGRYAKPWEYRGRHP